MDFVHSVIHRAVRFASVRVLRVYSASGLIRRLEQDRGLVMALAQPLDSDATCEAEKSWTEEPSLARAMLLGTALAAHIDAAADHTAKRKGVQGGDMVVQCLFLVASSQPGGVAVSRHRMK